MASEVVVLVAEVASAAVVLVASVVAVLVVLVPVHNFKLNTN